MPLEIIDESPCFRVGTFQEEMDVVGHQYEREDADRVKVRENGDGIHSCLEIFLIPKPDALFQMIRGDKIKFHLSKFEV